MQKRTTLPSFNFFKYSSFSTLLHFMPIYSILQKAEADTECRMQELPSFIINPIQQLPRYIMLLSDLLKNTLPDHPDYTNIATALGKMKKLTEHVNEQV